MALNQAFLQQLDAQLPQLKRKSEEPLALHTSFRIGGPAELMVFPDAQELPVLLQLCREYEIAPHIIGGGTNLLAPDEGIRGVTICTRGALVGITQKSETEIEVLSGTSMAQAAMYACEHGLSGLEFAQGIPGTVGGGVYMNAGAYGGEIKQVATCTAVLLDNLLAEYRGESQGFSYRHSLFMENNAFILKTVFKLQEAAPEEIRQTMQTLAEKRRASQPLELPSAGSTFKRPQQGYAAALIEQAGLKGFTVGGAAVSEKHAGFVVNKGGATAADVLALVEQVQKRVQAYAGVLLEPEIRIIK